MACNPPAKVEEAETLLTTNWEVEAVFPTVRFVALKWVEVAWVRLPEIMLALLKEAVDEAFKLPVTRKVFAKVEEAEETKPFCTTNCPVVVAFTKLVPPETVRLDKEPTLVSEEPVMPVPKAVPDKTLVPAI